MSSNTKLRAFRLDDLPALLHVFHEAVHHIDQNDYTLSQREAWAPAEPDMLRWQEKLATEEVVVADRPAALAGFCAWTNDGYLDFLYVHPAHWREGVATQLYLYAEQTLQRRGVKRFHTQASLVALPFFVRQGFRVVQHQVVEVRGVEMPNAIMEKLLS